MLLLYFFFRLVTQTFIYQHFALSYNQYGSGKTPVLVLHGYDEQGFTYKFLEQFAGDSYSFYAIDMPFHGATTSTKKGRIEPTLMAELLKNFMEAQGRSQPWLIFGFSLGGRVALSLYQHLPTAFHRVLLLAPDGLKLNFWYWLSTQTLLGNLFFRSLTAVPSIPRNIIAGLGKIGILNDSLVRFCNYYLLNRERSDILYQRWTGLSRIKPDLEIIQKQIIQHGTRFTFIYGKHDRIIKPARGLAFALKTNGLAKVEVIDAGHMLFKEKTLPLILEVFQKNS